MSVGSKLFVVCDKGEVVSVGNAVVDALNKWVRASLDDHIRSNTEYLGRIQFLLSEDAGKANFTTRINLDSFDFNMFSINFGCGDENKRSLKMFPKDFGDHNHITEDNKISFRIGKWGMSDQIMKTVAQALEPFGDVYYDHNDCDKEDFVRITDFSENSLQFKN